MSAKSDRREWCIENARKQGWDAARKGRRRDTVYSISDYAVAWYEGYDDFVRKYRPYRSDYRIDVAPHPMCRCRISPFADFDSIPKLPDPNVLEVLREFQDAYSRNEFPITTVKDFKMNTSLAYIFASMLPDVISVSCVYPNSERLYTYKALARQGIAKSDKVVVNSPNSGLTVVTVVEIGTLNDIDPDLYNGYKWIVGKVEIGQYSDVIEREASFKARVAELQRQARRKEAVAKVAEQVGGLDVLKSLLAELSASKETAGVNQDENHGVV